ncbi:TolC family outer membrane protein [Rugamonas brunnea]|uniref:TolC family outer membrane protein n=1 Tax=Rugamonas brunnea TaxID=2758569 RepID=UPI004055A08F
MTVARTPLMKRLLPLALAAAGLLTGANASAIGLLQAYEAALKNDPTFRADVYTAESAKENRVLGRSNLLPNISGSYSGNRNNTTVEQQGHIFPEDYISRSATVQVRQSLFNLDGWARYKQGVAQSEYGEAQFASRQQEVITRLVSAYVDALFKEDQVALAKAERDVYVEQKKVNELLFKKGEGTRTDVLETQSRLDLAEAQLLEAQDGLVVARDTLGGIVGGDTAEPAPLRPGFHVAERDTLGYESWKKTALEHNPDLLTLSKGVEIATQEYNKQRAGHAPRLDLIGTYGKTGSESLTTINQFNTIRSVGFQLNVPIYSGGSVNASMRQAAAGREKAKADLDAQTSKVLVELRRNYNLVLSSIARIEALDRAVESAQLLVTATEQSIKGGVRINLDLLTAQRQLYMARRDRSEARYGYLLASTRLRAAAGILTPDDVRLIAAYFE